MRNLIVVLLSLISANILLSTSAYAAPQLTSKQLSEIKSMLPLKPLGSNTAKKAGVQNLAPYSYETYYMLMSPLSAANGTTVSSNKIPMSYEAWTSTSDNLFYSFIACPYVSTDYGDVELLPLGTCVRFDVSSFNGGSYYTETKSGTDAQLIYPGVNNIGCIVVSNKDDNYQDCTDKLRINYTGDLFPVYRFWSNTKQHHFYTIEHAEKRQVVDTYDDNTWNYEQLAWTAKKFNGSSCASGLPVYRFWSNQKQGHFYTISNDEKNYIQSHYPSNVWRYEGVAYCTPEYTGFCPDSSYAPVYRFWSDQKQGHFYTISSSEKDYIQATYHSNVWRYEGIGFCAQP